MTTTKTAPEQTETAVDRLVAEVHSAANKHRTLAERTAEYLADRNECIERALNAGVSQVAIAAAADLSQATIARIERSAAARKGAA